MTRDEALHWVWVAKWVAADDGQLMSAWMLEDVERVLASCVPADMVEYSQYVLAPGRKGRQTMVLCGPYEARARAFARAVLRSTCG